MSRSVATRAEIGRNPCRNRSISGSRSVVPVRGAMSRGWGSYESGRTAAGRLCRCSRGPGVVGVAHSHALGVGGNRGIMRNSNVGSGHGPVPMCVDPPDRTWEPDHHRRRSLEKPVIPTKNSPRPAEAPDSHVQHRRQPHPPRPTLRSVRLNPTHPTSRRARRARERKPHAAPQNRQRKADPRNRTDLDAGYDRSQAGTGPISMRNSTDLGAEVDRSRAGVRPISRRKRTDLAAEVDRFRCGVRPISARRGGRPYGRMCS